MKIYPLVKKLNQEELDCLVTQDPDSILLDRDLNYPLIPDFGNFISGVSFLMFSVFIIGNLHFLDFIATAFVLLCLIVPLCSAGIFLLIQTLHQTIFVSKLKLGQFKTAYAYVTKKDTDVLLSGIVSRTGISKTPVKSCHYNLYMDQIRISVPRMISNSIETKSELKLFLIDNYIVGFTS